MNEPDPIRLEDPTALPPWYDPDERHDRAATAEHRPVTTFTWHGLVGKRARITTDLTTYEATVVDFLPAPDSYAATGWVEIEHPGRLAANAPDGATPPTLRALVNLAHVRTIRPL